MKSIRQLKNELKRTAWYKQGGAGKPVYLSHPWLACHSRFTAFHRPTPVFYHGPIAYHLAEFWQYFFPRLYMKRVAAYFMARQQRDPDFLSRVRAGWESDDAAAIRRVMQFVDRNGLQHLSDKDLTKFFHWFCKLYERFWHECILLDAFDLEGDTLLERALAHEHRPVSFEEKVILTTPVRPSWLIRERRSFFQLAEQARKNPLMVQALKRHLSTKKFVSRFPKFWHAVEQHAAAYHWTTNDYAIIQRRGPATVLSQLRHLVNDSAFHNEAQALKQAASASRRRTALMHRRRFSRRALLVADALVLLAEWRDERKAHNQMGSSVLHDFLREFQRRFHVPLMDLEYSFYWELQKWLSGRPFPVAKIRLRQGQCLVYGHPRRGQEFHGAAARTLGSTLNQAVSSNSQLVGRTAVPGRATGTVRTIKTQADFRKMHRGDILVAVNTRPEFVPIMKIAGAIITDEGGLTSHAAIVSRELGIPAIVGMQGAMMALRDGDRVEVDATKGIVRELP